MKGLRQFLILFLFIIFSASFLILFLHNFSNYLIEVSPEIFIFLIFSSACFGLGDILIRSESLEVNLPERFVFSVSTGLIIFSILTTLFGFLGLLKRGFFILLLIVSFLVSIPSLIKFLRELNKKIQSINLKADFEFFCFILSLFLLIISSLFSLVPPTFYDSLEFHLAVPNYYILNGKISYMEGNVFSNMPLYLQMLYLFGILIKNEIMTSLFTFLMGAILVLSAISFGRRFLYKKYSFIPSLSLLSLPLTSFLISTPIADLPLSLFFFLSFYSFLLYKISLKPIWLILTGVFTGFSIGIKYQGFYLLFLITIFAIILGGELKKNLRAIIFIFTISLVLFSPWFLKNFCYTDNPVYPLFFNFLGGKGWSEENNERFVKDLHLKPSSHILPLLYQVNFSAKIFGAGGIIGPLFLIFFPFYFMKKRGKIANSLLLISALYLLPFLTTGNLRYSYFSILIFSLLIYYGVEELGNFKFLKSFSKLVFLIIIAFNSIISFSHLNLVNHGLNFILGIEKKEDFFKNTLPFFKGIEFINKELPSDSFVLFLYEARTAYIKRRFIAPTPYDDNLLKDLLIKYSDPEDILKILSKNGITHIFLNEIEMNRIEGKFDYLGIKNPEIRERFFSFLSKLKIVFADSGVYIYSLF